MTPTDEIVDPSWNDLFDRDREINRLASLLKSKEKVLDRVLKAYDRAILEFSEFAEEKEKAISILRKEIESMRAATLSSEEGGC